MASDEAKKAETAGAEEITIFDKIVAGEIPSSKVYEDDQVLAFKDISPQAPIHYILIPKKRAGMSQLSKATEENKDVLGHLMFIAAKLGRETPELSQGFRIVVNDGAQGCQSVYHLHIHILGGKQLSWPPGV